MAAGRLAREWASSADAMPASSQKGEWEGAGGGAVSSSPSLGRTAVVDILVRGGGRECYRGSMGGAPLHTGCPRGEQPASRFVVLASSSAGVHGISIAGVGARERGTACATLVPVTMTVS